MSWPAQNASLAPVSTRTWVCGSTASSASASSISRWSCGLMALRLSGRLMISHVIPSCFSMRTVSYFFVVIVVSSTRVQAKLGARSVAQEALDRLGDSSGLFDMRQVAGLGNDRERGARDQALEGLGIGRRNDAVAVAPDDVSGDLHPMQPALQLRIEEARLPSETRAGDAVENGEVLILLSADSSGGFLADLRIRIGEALHLFRVEDENIRLRHAFDVDASGRDQR